MTYISWSSDFSSFFFFFFALKNILVLLAKHDSGELRCPATAPVTVFSYQMVNSHNNLGGGTGVFMRINTALKSIP